MQNPTLTPEELFELLARERGWVFNPGACHVNWDPTETGAAAGGRHAGQSVFALIQVTDRQGRSVALARGEYIGGGERHAEEKAIAALNNIIPLGADLRGGTMTVVLDQEPCSPDRRDCLGHLRDYANTRGLKLEIWLPTRQRVVGQGEVAPRTAMMTSMIPGMPELSLRMMDL